MDQQLTNPDRGQHSWAWPPPPPHILPRSSRHQPDFCSGPPKIHQSCTNSITTSTGSQGNWHLTEFQKPHTNDSRGVAVVTRATSLRHFATLPIGPYHTRNHYIKQWTQIQDHSKNDPHQGSHFQNFMISCKKTFILNSYISITRRYIITKTEITTNIMAHNRTLSLWLKDTINMRCSFPNPKKGEMIPTKERKEADESLQLAGNVTPIVFWMGDLFAQKRDCLRFKMY